MLCPDPAFVHPGHHHKGRVYRDRRMYALHIALLQQNLTCFVAQSFHLGLRELGSEFHNRCDFEETKLRKSTSLMYSQRRSCSICRSRSDMPAIVLRGFGCEHNAPVGSIGFHRNGTGWGMQDSHNAGRKR